MKTMKDLDELIARAHDNAVKSLAVKQRAEAQYDLAVRTCNELRALKARVEEKKLIDQEKAQGWGTLRGDDDGV